MQWLSRSRRCALGALASGALLACGAGGGPPASGPAAPPEAVAPPPAPEQADGLVGVRGLVRDAAGAAVRDAVVAAVEPRSDRPGAIVRSGDDGRFAVRLKPGSWAFTATSAAGAAAYREPAEIGAADDVVLALGEQGFEVSGRIETPDPLPPDAAVIAGRISDAEGDLFVALPTPDRRYRLRLPSARGYEIRLSGTATISLPVVVRRAEDQTADLASSALAPPPAAVVDWIKAHAVALRGAEPDATTGDLAPLASVIGDARVIGVGEATHGTREFFQLKHRMLQYAAEALGVTVFAIEAGLPEARSVNRYVNGGPGTAIEAIRPINGIWKTDEVVALVDWMRAYNLDRRHKTRLRFVGVDMQDTRTAWAGVQAYLARVDPRRARALPPSLAILEAPFWERGERWRKLDPAQRKATRDAAEALVHDLDERRAYLARSDGEAWRAAREDARVLAQALTMVESELSGVNAAVTARDAAMAENARWTLDQEGPQSRMFLWAHNGHISNDFPAFPSLGSHLRRALGDRYRSFGVVFSEGSFRAWDGKAFAGFTLDAPDESDASTAFVRAGCQLCVVDLRPAAGPVAAWLGAPHPVRWIEFAYKAGQRPEATYALSRYYDAVLFVRTTSAARKSW